MPSARKLIAVPPTIWSARRVIEKNACTSPRAAPESRPMTIPSCHDARHVRAPDREERAHQHHPLEADVHDARALGEEAAERREDQRRREPQRRREERAPDDDGVEILHARSRREEADDEARRPGRRGVRADAPLAADPGPDPDRHGNEADDDGDDGLRIPTGGSAATAATIPTSTPAHATAFQPSGSRSWTMTLKSRPPSVRGVTAARARAR